MNSEARTCQSCKKQFTIEPDDFSFYEKMKVPAPIWCSRCQLQKRLCFRNERVLYKRACDAPGHGEELISNYSKDKPVKVYDFKFWLGDGWDPLAYGRYYDFSKPFFEQMKGLIRDVPWPSLFNVNAVNSDYCNFTTDNKNCYLVFGGDFNENCSYSSFNFHSKDSMELYFTEKCELCYELVDAGNCYGVSFGRYCKDCSDSAFLWNCVNCQNCFGCVNLKNKRYCIFNEQYSKDEYEKRVRELDTGSYAGLTQIKKKFEALKLRYPHRFAGIFRSVGCTGDNIFEGKNCKDCFDVTGPAEDLNHVVLGGWNLKDCRNTDHAGHQSELIFDSFAVFSGAQRVAYSYLCGSCQDIRYCYNCQHSTNLFGCVGVKHKSYCILNKQYTKEDYEVIVSKIIEHMGTAPYRDKKGRVYRYGESLPAELSPWAYNETIANEYFSLDRALALEQGYAWKDPDEKHYTATRAASDLPDHIKDAKDSILNETISCLHEGTCNEQCTTAFKIIPEELSFYRRMNLPLPRLCSNCRHYERLKQRNPLKLWHCQCACDYKVYANTIKHQHHPEGRCPNEFETSYAPDRPEIVYCEPCYNAEVA